METMPAPTGPRAGVAGTYVSAAIGTSRMPSGLVGAGTMGWSDDGVVIDGSHKNNNLTSVLGILGFLLGFVGVIVAAAAFHLSSGKWMASLPIGGAVGGSMLGWRLSRARPLRTVIPWKKLKKLERDERGIRFMSKVRPRGEVVFTPSVPSEADALFAEMKARAR
jgi:hypothetical protein